MNMFLWVLQSILALHTVMGALWKFSNPEQTVPSLQAIPHGAWLAMAVIELVCAAVLVLPAFKPRMAIYAPMATLFVAAEMIVFSGLHLSSGEADKSPVIYWMVVAAVCGFIAYGRLKLKRL